MKLKLAGSNFSFRLLPFEGALDVIVRLDLAAVDICMFEGHNHLNPSTELRQPARSGARLRRLLAQRGLTLADLFLVAANSRETLAPNNPDPRDNARSREIFERSLDYLNAAGGSHLTQLPGVWFKRDNKARSFDRASQELAWRTKRAAGHGIVYSVEPHVGSIIETPADAARLAKLTPGLTYSLDYTHFTKAGYADGEIEPLLRYASHFHVRGARKGRLQTPFSQNQINYKRVLRAMRKHRYTGFQAIEYVWIEWEHCNECDNLSEIIRFRDFLNVAAKEL